MQKTDPAVRAPGVSDNPSLLQFDIARFGEFRERLPFIRWETLSDAADSTYEEYVTGDPSLGNSSPWETKACSGWSDGPYFAPDEHEWGNNHRIGGKKGVQNQNQVPATGFYPGTGIEHANGITFVVLDGPSSVCRWRRH